MKPILFFRDKANIYLNELNDLIPNFISMTDKFSNQDDNNIDYHNQQKEIDSLILKIRILFSEFDNKYFIDFIDKKVTGNAQFCFDTKGLETYKTVLLIFIETLDSFRD